MSVKRKGARLPHLGGKGDVGLKTVDMDASFIGTSVSVAAAILPPAWCYFETVGTVDLREQGGYIDRNQGTGALYIDTPPSQQGGYFNR